MPFEYKNMIDTESKDLRLHEQLVFELPNMIGKFIREYTRFVYEVENHDPLMFYSEQMKTWLDRGKRESDSFRSFLLNELETQRGTGVARSARWKMPWTKDVSTGDKCVTSVVNLYKAYCAENGLTVRTLDEGSVRTIFSEFKLEFTKRGERMKLQVWNGSGDVVSTLDFRGSGVLGLRQAQERRGGMDAFLEPVDNAHNGRVYSEDYNLYGVQLGDSITDI